MKALVRHTFLIMFIWLMLVGICLGKQVYLKDGGIIDSQSAWQRGGKVYVLVNRDIIADFDQSEIDLRRTFPRASSPSRRLQRKVTARAAAAPPATKLVSAPVVTAPAVVPPPKPAAPPQASAASEPLSPAAPSTEPAEAAIPPDKAELERRKQEAAKMMTEAVLKKDSELMKKALEMQKSAMPQGAAMQQKAGIPLYVPLMILVACILIIVAQWIIFQRAGQAGWKCLIPFYNMYILMQISGKPGWWMFLLLVPLVGVVILLLAMLSLAKKFRRSELFGVGLFLLPMIFFPVLAFGGSEYEG